MIQGMFGDVELAKVQISDLRQQYQNTMNQPVKQQQRQSLIFSQHNFHIEIQRPNFDSIQLNHPLLSMDLNDILKSQFFENNAKRFSEMLKKNEYYLNEYSNKQDQQQIAMENVVDQKQILQMNAPIRNNNQNMKNQNDQCRKTAITSYDQEKLKSEFQKQNNSCYPFFQQPQINQDFQSQNNVIIKSTITSEKDLNEIINFFKQNNNDIDQKTVKFYIEATNTKDPKTLLEFHKSQY